MRDHKDLTNYSALPVLVLPAGSCRPLTSSECLAYADYYEARADRWYALRDRRRDLKETAAFRRLAIQRATLADRASAEDLAHIREHGTLRP